jgi:glycosyltransferase involved in cell wall biosynthesis
MQMISEYVRAHVVVSLPETDGAPATVMEALCMGAHVVASGGPTVRQWVADFGGTYGEPADAEEAHALLVGGLEAAAREGREMRRARAQRARAAFSRDTLLEPLRLWIEGAM